jgi:hypothetical protein
LVCPRLGLSVRFSGHSARAGQTLAKKAIKEKNLPVVERRIESFLSNAKVLKKYKVALRLSSFFRGRTPPPTVQMKS